MAPTGARKREGVDHRRDRLRAAAPPDARPLRLRRRAATRRPACRVELSSRGTTRRCATCGRALGARGPTATTAWLCQSRRCRSRRTLLRERSRRHGVCAHGASTAIACAGRRRGLARLTVACATCQSIRELLGDRPATGIIVGLAVGLQDALESGAMARAFAQWHESPDGDLGSAHRHGGGRVRVAGDGRAAVRANDAAFAAARAMSAVVGGAAAAAAVRCAGRGVGADSAHDDHDRGRRNRPASTALRGRRCGSSRSRCSRCSCSIHSHHLRGFWLSFGTVLAIIVGLTGTCGASVCAGAVTCARRSSSRSAWCRFSWQRSAASHWCPLPSTSSRFRCTRS